jgi:hypothetical protein
MKTALLTLTLWASTSFAQRLTFGAIAGTNLTDDIQSGRFTQQEGTRPSGESASSTSIYGDGGRRPILGLKLEYELLGGWAIEFNALHREIKSRSSFTISPPIELFDGRKVSQFGPNTRTLATWQFPLLLKYRLPVSKLHPFVVAGPSFRPAGTGSGLSHVGISGGGGVELNAGGFRISPSLRYTRWSSANRSLFGGALVNQVEFLTSFDRPSATRGFSAFGRRLSIGAIAGIALGKDFQAPVPNQGIVPESYSGVFGVMIEAPVSENFAVEVNGLYRPLHGSQPESNRTVRFAHLTWEFPVLLKYRFPSTARLRPFIEGGPSFRAEGNLNLRPVSHFGAAAGVGVESNLSRLKISPRVRYTYWGGEKVGAFPQTWANQTQLLVAFSF